MRSFFAMIASWVKKAFDFIFRRGKTDPPDDPGVSATYYGCPASKTSEKLQLTKTPYGA